MKIYAMSFQRKTSLSIEGSSSPSSCAALQADGETRSVVTREVAPRRFYQSKPHDQNDRGNYHQGHQRNPYAKTRLINPVT